MAICEDRSRLYNAEVWTPSTLNGSAHLTFHDQYWTASNRLQSDDLAECQGPFRHHMPLWASVIIVPSMGQGISLKVSELAPWQPWKWHSFFSHSLITIDNFTFVPYPQPSHMNLVGRNPSPWVAYIVRICLRQQIGPWQEIPIAVFSPHFPLYDCDWGAGVVA